MWITYIAFPLALAAVVGAIVGGGVFLVPVAVVLVLVGMAPAVKNRSAAAKSKPTSPADADPSETPLPHRFPSSHGRVPNDPDVLTRARQEQQ